MNNSVQNFPSDLLIFDIWKYLPVEVLLKYCKSNKDIGQICENQETWFYLLQRDFGPINGPNEKYISEIERYDPKYLYTRLYNSKKLFEQYNGNIYAILPEYYDQNDVDDEGNPYYTIEDNANNLYIVANGLFKQVNDPTMGLIYAINEPIPISKIPSATLIKYLSDIDFDSAEKYMTQHISRKIRQNIMIDLYESLLENNLILSKDQVKKLISQTMISEPKNI